MSAEGISVPGIAADGGPYAGNRDFGYSAAGPYSLNIIRLSQKGMREADLDGGSALL